ncbi:hypothetical protein ACS0TY_021172 [Phlomoides rotata]
MSFVFSPFVGGRRVKCRLRFKISCLGGHWVSGVAAGVTLPQVPDITKEAKDYSLPSQFG